MPYHPGSVRVFWTTRHEEAQRVWDLLMFSLQVNAHLARIDLLEPTWHLFVHEEEATAVMDYLTEKGLAGRGVETDPQAWEAEAEWFRDERSGRPGRARRILRWLGNLVR